MNIWMKIRNIFLPDIGDRIHTQITRENTHNLRIMTGVTVLLESFVLLLFILTSEDPFGKGRNSIFSVLICIVVSLAIHLHLRAVHRSVRRMEEVRNRENIVLIIYFIILANWGMAASLRHYIVGEQMLTFFIVEMMFAGFVTLHPISAFILVFGTFGEFLFFLFRTDGCAGVNILNYSAMAVLCYLAVLMKYRRSVRQITNDLEITSLNVKLGDLARNDALTGIGNRLAVRSAVRESVNRDICVMMCDVDLFKQINDEAGHDAGDEVLSHIASTLKNCFPKDSCFRYGGDEFLIIAEDMRAEEFNRCLDRWLEEVQVMHTDEGEIRVGVSYGIAVGRPASEEHVRNLIHHADQNLYEMKKIHHSERED